MSTKSSLSKYQIRHIEYVKNRVAKAIGAYQMIDKNDRVLVAISGGKDSLVLLEALSALRNYNFLQFELEALHINVEDVSYQVDREKLTSLADGLSVKLQIKNIQSGIENREKKRPVSFVRGIAVKPCLHLLLNMDFRK